MIFFIALLAILLTIAALSYVIKLWRRRALQSVFRAFNERLRNLEEEGQPKPADLETLTSWIDERRSEGRLIEIIDYLQTIERPDLAVAVYNAFPFDRYTSRHVRLFAAKSFLKLDDEEKCLTLCQRLMEAYPKDDSILDLFIDAHIHFGEIDIAKTHLLPRLDRKFEGTVFARHMARIHAAEGEYKKAAIIMQKVVSRDYTLAQNTFAQPQKRFIQQQYARSKALLEEYQDQVETPSEETADAPESDRQADTQ
ncbi:hypothetical protein SCOR_21770 [Sulfidibacter corallicola]|uniref:Tetratricopeptide repeat protein n=1 Tax=Sulfidibacter corallicola TaxID=2818388 RepID=A0A8A4U2J5_SULCO|nr:hypothetical protein [Sulfidibacter corallicola]QTD52945.1 hypothetical protein J3U87_10775 [Sulfidibacter corallicola]